MTPLDVSQKERKKTTKLRVIRGGSWCSLPVRCRSAYRRSSHPANAYDFIGFRVCCLLTSPHSLIMNSFHDLIPLAPIPAGRFQMGSPPSEEGRSDDEGPQHEVEFQEFFLSRTPITQAQWREVAGWVEGPGERWGLDLSGKLEPSFFRGDNRPVERVSWYEAMEFCYRLSQRTGLVYTLPSEAQWEYACRAGTTTPYNCGETISTAQANFSGEGTTPFSGEGTTPVGIYPPNDWGLHDMHGNVCEWCLDEWHDDYDGAPTDGSAWDAAWDAGVKRLLRGGSWDLYPVLCRSASRYFSPPASAINDLGFRVCCLPQT